jgi:hypothetical protein
MADEISSPELNGSNHKTRSSPVATLSMGLPGMEETRCLCTSFLMTNPVDGMDCMTEAHAVSNHN